MKIRKGFVSNSSSSSFVCEICSASETGRDCSPRDLGFVGCENGHIFCECHLINDIVIIEDDEDCDLEDQVCQERCPICCYLEISYSDIARYYLKTTEYTKDEVFEEIKKVNKRRKKVYNNEYVEYVLGKLNTNTNVLLEELKVKYPKYSDFLQFLRK